MILKIDKDGFLINEGKIENIPERILVILKEILLFAQNELGDNLLSTYIRGSVSVGRFINNVSDIDFVVVVKAKPNQQNIDNFLKYSLDLDKKYNWVCGFDLFVCGEEELLNTPGLNKLRVYLKTQSVLMFGQDIVSNFKKYKPDKELSQTLLSEIDREFNFLNTIFLNPNQDFQYNNQIRGLDFWCIWMSRTVLRFSLYASLNQHHSYTNDLVDCYQIVSKIYPEFENDLKQALDWSQAPIKDQIALRAYFEKVAPKIKSIFKVNNL
jgi:predicted nucleotidyltransferase